MGICVLIKEMPGQSLSPFLFTLYLTCYIYTYTYLPDLSATPGPHCDTREIKMLS